jgi:hypothetical protein
MLVKDLKKILNDIPDNAKILFSSDEELNILRTEGVVAELTDRKNTFVVYGLDSSELDSK